MRLYGDSKTTIHIVGNFMFHKRTKHIELDCHIVLTDTKWIGHQFVDILTDTKSLGRTRIDFICDKLGMYDIYLQLKMER